MTTTLQLFMSCIHQLLFRLRQVECLPNNLPGHRFLRWMAVNPFQTDLPTFLDVNIYSAEQRPPFLDFLLLVSTTAGGAGSWWKISPDKLRNGQLGRQVRKVSVLYHHHRFGEAQKSREHLSETREGSLIIIGDGLKPWIHERRRLKSEFEYELRRKVGVFLIPVDRGR